MKVAAWSCGTPKPSCHISSSSDKKCARYQLCRKFLHQGKVDQSSPKSLKTCNVTIPPMCQISSHSAKRCMRKALQIFTPSSILAPRGPPGAKVHRSLGTDVQQGPDYQCAKFHPLLATCPTRYMLLNFVDFVESEADKNSKRRVCTYQGTTKR